MISTQPDGGINSETQFSKHLIPSVLKRIPYRHRVEAAEAILRHILLVQQARSRWLGGRRLWLYGGFLAEKQLPERVRGW